MGVKRTQSVQVQMRPVEELLKKRGIERGGEVQKYIDSKVVSLCDKYVPMLTGLLKRAVGTVYGSGYVRYNTPYAKKQYYDNSGHSRGARAKEGMAYGGLRGRLWFERMKAVHKDEILQGAANLAGAKGRRRN